MSGLIRRDRTHTEDREAEQLSSLATRSVDTRGLRDPGPLPEPIEEALENHGLIQVIKANSREETLNLADAQSFYKTLEKKFYIIFII